MRMKGAYKIQNETFKVRRSKIMEACAEKVFQARYIQTPCASIFEITEKSSFPARRLTMAPKPLQ
jgi:hypothetical protein